MLEVADVAVLVRVTGDAKAVTEESAVVSF
jgi:hypothetical protein